MEIIKKHFNELTCRELYEILRARAEVFVVEQNCAYQDIDGTDCDAVHMYILDGDKTAAYLRVFMRDAEHGIAQIGRVITLRRGEGLGLLLLRAGIREAFDVFGAESIHLEAQKYAEGFYEKAGFRTVSEEFPIDGIPHVEMILYADTGKEDIG